MRALLDTHAFLWTVTDDRRLSPAARACIADGANELLLSAASMWEIVLKSSAGKLSLKGGAAHFLEQQIQRAQLRCLPIAPEHMLRVASLPALHRDPFDRLLIAQAQAEKLPLITGDPAIRRYAVQVIW